MRAILRTLRTGPPTRSPRRNAIELTAASIWMVLFVTACVSLITQAGGGFYILALVMGFMFAWNIYVAWVLITEISN